MKRRTFFKGLLAGAAAVSGFHLPFANAADYRRQAIRLRPGGRGLGSDQFCGPKTNTPGERIINHWPRHRLLLNFSASFIIGCLTLLTAAAWVQPQASYRIDTFVGRVAIGDEGSAVEAQLNRPDRVAVDRAGNLYIADQSNHSIRKVDATGTITTIAGTGARGFSGDEGPAAEAQLAYPHAVSVDGAGNLYIADTSNHRVRKVDATGTITTIAGTGARGFSGDEGPAAEAQLAYPHAVSVDGAGNLYIADTSNHRVRKVDATGTITTIAGTGARGFSGDEGPAAEAQLAYPHAVSVDEAGNLYIADTFNQRIRKVEPPGRSPRSRGPGSAVSAGTAVRRPRHSSASSLTWRWTGRATSISPI